MTSEICNNFSTERMTLLVHWTPPTISTASVTPASLIIPATTTATWASHTPTGCAVRPVIFSSSDAKSTHLTLHTASRLMTVSCRTPRETAWPSTPCAASTVTFAAHRAASSLPTSATSRFKRRSPSRTMTHASMSLRRLAIYRLTWSLRLSSGN